MYATCPANNTLLELIILLLHSKDAPHYGIFASLLLLWSSTVLHLCASVRSRWVRATVLSPRNTMLRGQSTRILIRWSEWVVSNGHTDTALLCFTPGAHSLHIWMAFPDNNQHTGRFEERDGALHVYSVFIKLHTQQWDSWCVT